ENPVCGDAGIGATDDIAVCPDITGQSACQCHCYSACQLPGYTAGLAWQCVAYALGSLVSETCALDGRRSGRSAALDEYVADGCMDSACSILVDVRAGRRWDDLAIGATWMAVALAWLVCLAAYDIEWACASSHRRDVGDCV